MSPFSSPRHLIQDWSASTENFILTSENEKKVKTEKMNILSLDKTHIKSFSSLHYRSRRTSNEHSKVRVIRLLITIVFYRNRVKIKVFRRDAAESQKQILSYGISKSKLKCPKIFFFHLKLMILESPCIPYGFPCNIRISTPLSGFCIMLTLR